MRALVAAVAALVFAGACATTDSPSGPPADDRPTVLFLGDSYTEGPGLFVGDVPSRWSTVMSARNGWREVNAGCNGSGYVRPGLACGTNYGERLDALANTDPDIVFVSGGVNDLSYDEDTVAATVAATLDAIVETFPEATVYVVNGIFYTGDETPPELSALNAALEDAARASGVAFLDIGDPLLGKPELMAPDKLHPNPDGHALLAAVIQREYEVAA